MRSVITHLMRFRIAELGLSLDARESEISLFAPDCHTKFLSNHQTSHNLTLHVRDGPLHSTEKWTPLFVDAETWQLWLDDNGCQVFASPRSSPPLRHLVVNKTLEEGELVGDFSQSLCTKQPVFPLDGMDILLFANWLSGFGDLILHSSAIDYVGEGFCFVGPSGAGKSTLAASLAGDPSVRILGEDSSILRLINDRFLLYGTPWHTNPALCSPGGVPLKKIFFLDQKGEHAANPLNVITGIERLLRESYIPYYLPAGIARILDNLGRLAEQIPFFSLSFKPGEELLRLIKES